MSNFSQTYLKISLLQRPLQATFGKSVNIRLCRILRWVSVRSLVTIKCKPWLSHSLYCYLMVSKFFGFNRPAPPQGGGTPQKIFFSVDLLLLLLLLLLRRCHGNGNNRDVVYIDNAVYGKSAKSIRLKWFFIFHLKCLRAIRMKLLPALGHCRGHLVDFFQIF